MHRFPSLPAPKAKVPPARHSEEEESEVRSENVSKGEETYLMSDSLHDGSPAWPPRRAT